MTREDFLIEFRQEHRQIRDLLFDMITSFIQKDLKRSAVLLNELDILTGPHFRYEEEALYPALIKIYGEFYINKLISDHDLAIARAMKLSSMLSKENYYKEDQTECINTVRSILPHVSDCEGLSIMVEKLDDSDIRIICKSVINARTGNTPLIEWAETARNRKLLSFKNESIIS